MNIELVDSMKAKTLDKESIRETIKSAISGVDISSLEKKIMLVKEFASDLQHSEYDRDWIYFLAEPLIVALIHSQESQTLDWIVRGKTFVANDKSGSRAKISPDYTKSNYYQLAIHNKEGHLLYAAAGPFIELLKARAESHMDCELDENSILRYYSDTKNQNLAPVSRKK